MDPETPPVSVIVPYYKADKTIRATIASVAHDLPSGSEIIIVDDGSPVPFDEALVASTPVPLRICRIFNGGPSAARNTGAALATHDVLYFLDADDLVAPGTLPGGLSHLSDDAIDMVFLPRSIRELDGRLSVRQPFRIGPFDEMLADILKYGWCTPHSILWRKAYFFRVGPWNETLRRNEDGYLHASALLGKPKVAVSAEGSATYVQHMSAGRVSARRDRLALETSLEVYVKLRARMTDAEWPLSIRSLAHGASELARECYECGAIDIGREAERFARQNGGLVVLGSLPHRILVGLIGLRAKSSLSRKLRPSRRTAAGHAAE